MTAMEVRVVYDGVRIVGSHGADGLVVGECLARSRSLRAALVCQQHAQYDLPHARWTLEACQRAGVDLQVHPGALGLPRLAIVRPERASRPLREAIEAHSVALGVLLRHRQSSRLPAPSPFPSPVQERLL